MVGWLVGWLVGRLVGWLVGRLVGWLVSHPNIRIDPDDGIIRFFPKRRLTNTVGLVITQKFESIIQTMSKA